MLPMQFMSHRQRLTSYTCRILNIWKLVFEVVMQITNLSVRVNSFGLRFLSALALVFTLSSVPSIAVSADKEELDIKVQEALQRFKTEVDGGDIFLERAEGVLVFPSVLKGGIGVGAEYGEGALLVGDKILDYYSTAGASIGLQLGVQSKTVILVFLDGKALSEFRHSKGWEAGVDGSVALVKWGVGEDLSTKEISDPIVGFVFSNKGLMYNLTIEGSKYTRIEK